MSRRGMAAVTPQSRRARADADLVVEAYVAGERPVSIAGRYGCHHSTIDSILEGAGVERRLPPGAAARADSTRIRRLRREGAGIAELAAEYDCSHDTIVRICAGVRKRRKSEPRRVIDTAVVVEAVERLGSQVAAARELGVAKATVSRHVALARGPRARPRLSIAEMCRRYRAGESTADIARAAGVSSSTVVRRLRGAGVPLRKPMEVGPKVRALRAAAHDVAFLYQQGCSAAEIGGLFGVAPRAVLDLLDAEAVPKRRPGYRTREQHQAAVRALAAVRLRVVPAEVAATAGSLRHVRRIAA